jgi:Fatty acid desaturase
MAPVALDDYRSRSAVLDAPPFSADALRAQPLDAETVRAFRYMEGVESYTPFYLRSLLATRAAHEPEIAKFLSGWVYEETGHGLAIAALLAANGTPIAARASRRETLRERITAAGAAWVSRWRSDFAAVHMLWGAINELTAVTAYRRLARRSGHPVVEDLCARLARDEARHFSFYFEQARGRLDAPRTQRLARGLIGRFWAPVGSGVEPEPEVRFVAVHLFSGDEGRAAAQRIDETIRTLPGMGELRLFGHWLEGALPAGIPSGFVQPVT